MAFMDLKLIMPKLFYVLQEVPKRKDQYHLVATYSTLKDANKASGKTNGTVFLGSHILKNKTKFKIIKP